MCPQPWGSLKSRGPRSCGTLGQMTAPLLDVSSSPGIWKMRHGLSKALSERTGWCPQIISAVAAARQPPPPKLIGLAPALPAQADQEGATGWKQPAGLTRSSAMGKQPFATFWLQCKPGLQGNRLLHRQIASSHQGWQRGSVGTLQIITHSTGKHTRAHHSQSSIH